MTSFYSELDGVKIHYEKFGSGPKTLLLIPAAIGTPRTDYLLQINGGLDQSVFTIIAIELPGWGRSRPPERDNSIDNYSYDARVAAILMEKLGYSFYSVSGWCYGARVASLMATNNPARVDKLVICCIVPYVTDYDRNVTARIRDTALFEPKLKKLHLIAYGQQLFDQLWHNYIDYFLLKNPSTKWDIREQLRCIECPTLILHGDKDPMIDKNHPETAERLIPDCRLYRFANGSHDTHIMHSRKFNRIVTDFLLEEIYHINMKLFYVCCLFYDCFANIKDNDNGPF